MRLCLIGMSMLILNFHIMAQQPYEIIKDSSTGIKIFKGIISEELLIHENSFTWMSADLSGYSPKRDLIDLLINNKDNIHLIVFAGTWCEDTHYILPRLFKLLHLAAYPKEKISLLGVDRRKQTLGFLAESLSISRIPTIIIMHKGKERGRIIEYGKHGNTDTDFKEILESL